MAPLDAPEFDEALDELSGYTESNLAFVQLGADLELLLVN